MAPDVAPIERLQERPIAIEPAAIEDEFSRIWRETSGAGYDESSIRLRVLNFVGLGREAAALDRFEHVMGVMPQQHPCRGIVAMKSPQQPRLEASIAAHCWRAPGAGGRHVCSEEVLLRGGEGDAHALASTVLALLVAELPVVLWLIGGVDLQSPLEMELVDAADGVFIDTADGGDAPQALRTALELHRQHEVELCDLAWRRLTAWRALVAQFFDGEEGAHQLSQLQAIEISCGGDAVTSEALLIGGWLTSALGLSLADLEAQPGRIKATLYDATRGVTLSVHAMGGDPDLRLSEVRIRTAAAAFVVALHPESAQIHVREEWPEAPVHRTVAQVATDDASIFLEALDDHSDHAVALEALRGALTLLGE